LAYIVSFESPQEIETEWRGLLSKSADPAVFLGPTWLNVWWSEFRDDRELSVAAVRRDGEVVGVAPLLRQNGTLMLAGDTEICDYMDITAAQGEEPTILEALTEELAKQDWDKWLLWGLRAGSPTLQALPALAENIACDAEVEFEDVSPRVELPGSWDDYLGRLSKKDRHELRRKLRRLSGAETEVDLVEYRTPEDVNAHMDEFLRLHTISREEKAEFMTPQMADFFRHMSSALAEEGHVRLFQLEVDDTCAAAVLCFNSGDELLLYNSGYDPALSSLSVGLLSKALSLQKAIEEGKRYYNFLRGAEPYKYDLGAQDLNIYRCTIRRR
jgi:CelD/BcsL family acetyltransferase involved in cellulose biosynthesis